MRSFLLVVLVFLSLHSWAQEKNSVDWGYELLQAIADSSMDSSIVALNKGADVNFYDPYSQVTPLIIAAEIPHLALIDTLLNRGAKVNFIPENGVSALLAAVNRSNLIAAEKLIRAGAELNQSDEYGRTALHYAVYNYDLLMADMLLYYEIAVDSQDYQQITPINLAAMLDDYEMIALLHSYGASLETPDLFGYTPFLNAVLYGGQYATESLWDLGANVFAQSSDSLDAFQLACEAGNLEIARWLLDTSFSVDAPIGGLSLYDRAKIFHRHPLRRFLKEKEVKRFNGFYFSHFEIGWEQSLNWDDYFMGARFGVEENYTNLVFSLSYAGRIFREPVLIHSNETWFQFWENRHFFALGVDKKIDVWGGSKSTAGFYLGYKHLLSWGSYDGSNQSPGIHFLPAPGVGWFLENYYLGMRLGVEHFALPTGIVNPWRIHLGLHVNIPRPIAKVRYH